VSITKAKNILQERNHCVNCIANGEGPCPGLCSGAFLIEQKGGLL